jgi:hypothetical protein
METKQTAVEWLRLKIKNKFEVYGDKDEFKEMFEQAKQIEKEQIMDAFVNGEHQQGFENESEQYYNETYGN